MINSDSRSTALAADLIAELIPDLQTQAELNEFEQANIALAVRWASKSRTLKKNLLAIESLKLLHKQMFYLTWNWAGSLRSRDTNIGISSVLIVEELKKLCDDIRFQIDKEIFPFDEIAARFHHRLVSIHAFPNGNGRHARLAVDLLLDFNKQQAFTWGRGDLIDAGLVRESYIKALQTADKGDITALLEFARS